ARARRGTPGLAAASAATVAGPKPLLGRASAAAKAVGSSPFAASSTGPAGVERATSTATFVRATIVADPNQAGPPDQPATFGGYIGICPASRNRASWALSPGAPVTRRAHTSHGAGPSTTGADVPPSPACSAARTSERTSRPDAVN